MSRAAPLSYTHYKDLRIVRRGKVRDVYEVSDEHFLIVATDRISAFDCVLPTPIPRKGEVLTQLSRFWFDRLSSITPHHLVTANIEEMPERSEERRVGKECRSRWSPYH